MENIPKATIKRALKRSKGLRVSDEAVSVLQEYIDGVLSNVAEDASAITENAGRVTISGKDISLAITIGY